MWVSQSFRGSCCIDTIHLRNLLRLSKLFRAPITQQSGVQFQCLSFCNRHGRQWRSTPSLLKYHLPSGLVLTILISGIAKLMILMHTSSALVCICWNSCEMGKSYFRALVLDPNFKLAYAKDKWDFEARVDGIACLKATVCIAHKSSGTMLTLF